MDRHVAFDQVKELGKTPATMRKKTVTVVGLGAIGSAVAEMFARAGVNLRVVDKDRVYEEDLDSLSLFTKHHVSKFKAKEIKDLLEALQPGLKVKAFHEELQKNNAYLVESDVIVECSGSLDTAMLVDAAAKRTPIVYVRAAGTQVTVFVTEETHLRDIKGFLEKHAPLGEGILPSTARLAAAVAVNKALHTLAGQKNEKSLSVIDTWHGTLEKVPVKKDKK